VLREYRGMFVTLKINSRLRGCIGNLSPKLPIGELVRKVAVQAAFEDPRFPRLTRAEFDRIKLDITVLGAMTRLKKPEDLEVGRHGVMISRGYQQGLLLPQVAVELGWNRRQLLEGVCQKAGLPVDAWKDKETQLFVFTADCFGEKL
jgi:AmmeMemoRadiSam system protein A